MAIGSGNNWGHDKVSYSDVRRLPQNALIAESPGLSGRDVSNIRRKSD